MRRSHWSYPLHRLAWSRLDWLFPPQCGGCGRRGIRWCDDCRRQVRLLTGPLCEVCGQVLSRPGRCESCRRETPPFQRLRSWAWFDFPVRPALHRLKYRRDMGLGDVLAVYLAEFTDSLHWSVDIVVPVPLSKKRLQERGYNQVALIAYPFSLALGLPYRPKALRRHRETASQVGLTAAERRENVRQAFVADPSLVKTKRVLLVDDIATTGATLAACSQALVQAGAQEVFALTVARAILHLTRRPNESPV